MFLCHYSGPASAGERKSEKEKDIAYCTSCGHVICTLLFLFFYFENKNVASQVFPKRGANKIVLLTNTCRSYCLSPGINDPHGPYYFMAFKNSFRLNLKLCKLCNETYARHKFGQNL